MGHKTLTEKLDDIKKEDLGIHFDQNLLWDELQAQLDNKPKAEFDFKILIAACITLLILFLPFVLLKDFSILNDQPAPIQRAEVTTPLDTSIAEVIEEIVPEKEVAQRPNRDVWSNHQPDDSVKVPTIDLDSDSLVNSTIAEMPLQELSEEIIKEKTKRRVFALQDLSIIQASLEKPDVERERGIAIKAQLLSGSRPSDLLTNKELKFTLYAKQD